VFNALITNLASNRIAPKPHIVIQPTACVKAALLRILKRITTSSEANFGTWIDLPSHRHHESTLLILGLLGIAQEPNLHFVLPHYHRQWPAPWGDANSRVRDRPVRVGADGRCQCNPANQPVMCEAWYPVLWRTTHENTGGAPPVGGSAGRFILRSG